MSTPVTMPQLGESVTEGTVTRWFKAVGEYVALDEDLFEVSTDKVDTEVPSPVAGYVEVILVSPDTTVVVGTELCRITEAATPAAEIGAVDSDAPPFAAPTASPPVPPTLPLTPPTPPPTPPPVPSAVPTASPTLSAVPTASPPVPPTVPLAQPVVPPPVPPTVPPVADTPSGIPATTTPVPPSVPPTPSRVPPVAASTPVTVSTPAATATPATSSAPAATTPATSSAPAATTPAEPARTFEPPTAPTATPTDAGSGADPFEAAVTSAVSDLDSIESPRATFRMQYPQIPEPGESLHAQPSQATEAPGPIEGTQLHAHPSNLTEPPKPIDAQPLHAHISGESLPEPRDGRSAEKPRARVTEEGEKRLSAGGSSDDLKFDGERRGILSPVVRKLADEYGVNLEKIIGTGTGGRITREDVISAAESDDAGLAPAAPAGLASDSAGLTAVASPNLTPPSDARVEPLSKMRIRIARHMHESKSNVAHVFASMEINCEAISRARDAHRDAFAREEGFSLTYLPFFGLAICNTLLEFPVVNSRIDIEAATATYRDHVNLGIAVDLDGQGLIVPNVRKAERMTLRELARNAHELAEKARTGELEPDDVADGTFTITNPGPFGTYLSVPVVSHPEVAILSLEGIAPRPVVRDGSVVAGLTTIIGLSWDHRAFDGGIAARFLAGVRERIEGWDWLTLAG